MTNNNMIENINFIFSKGRKQHEQQTLKNTFSKTDGGGVLNNACYGHDIIWVRGRAFNNDYCKFI